MITACSDNSVYINSENNPFACERVPETQRERCLERVMSAEEYERLREEILKEEENKQ